MNAALTFLCCLFAFLPQETSAPQKIAENLHEVRKIYLDEMGKSDDAERFKFLLDEKLSDIGFVVVENQNEADAILKGVLSTQLAAGTTKARVSVVLKSASGQRLWSDDFGVRFALRGGRDSVKLRAHDVANGLKDAWNKSAKKAGLKVSIKGGQ